MNERIYALGGRIDRPGIELIARELGLDMVRFRADLDTGRHRAQIEEDARDAVALGLTGTPAFFVNGRAVPGNQPLRVFAEVVDQELARAGAPAAGYDALVARATFRLDPDQTYRVGLGLPGHRLGPDDAPVTIVVWGDFECPFCAKLAPVLHDVHEKYGDDVRIVFRHLAMAMHPRAALAA